MYNRTYTKKIAGTGSAIAFDCGFCPKAVRILNGEGLCTLDWNDTMTSGYGYKILTGINATADTPSVQSLITSGGITPSNQGFTLGTDTDVNVSGEDLYVTAWE